MSDTESDYTDEDRNDFQDVEDDLQEDEEGEEEVNQQPDFLNVGQEDYLTNDLVITPDDKRVTSNMLTRYEIAELMGTRAQQIDKQGLHFAVLDHTTPTDLNALKIAALEFEQKRCPLLLKRVIEGKYVEFWNPNEMLRPKMKIYPD